MDNENENIPETPENVQPAGEAVLPAPKKKKALKIVLILLALLLVGFIVCGAVVVKMLGNLGNIKPTDGGNSSATEASSAIVEGTTAADGNGGTTEENAVQPSSGENSSGEEESAATDTEETASGSEVSTTDASREEKTTADAPGKTTEATTKAREEKTTAGRDTTTAPSQETTTAAPVTAKNEYDIYRGGHFYAVGSITDAEGTAPMELAVTDDSLYMTSTFDGTNIGILVNGKDTYMLYPEKKAYMEVNSLLLSVMGADADDLFNTDDMGFNRMGSLDKATDVCAANIGNVSCKRYTLPDGDESYHVYMNGNKLLRIEALDSGRKVESTIDFRSVTENVPADKTTPPKDYKKTGMFEFFGMLGEVLEAE